VSFYAPNAAQEETGAATAKAASATGPGKENEAPAGGVSQDDANGVETRRQDGSDFGWR